jgi:hypothetical protein
VSITRLLGTKSTETNGIDWDEPFVVSPKTLEYIIRAPAPQVPVAKRLPYFVKFFGDSDPIIAEDACHEFARASFKDIQAFAPQLPRDEIRKWLNNPEIAEFPLDMYGRLLGICGDASDAALMEKLILIKSDEARFGIDGVMCGYLLIMKEKGLEVLEKSKLLDKGVPFSEIFSVIHALRFMWTYGGDAISRDRLRQSMRILLDRPEIAEFAIADLARWKDWSIQDRLMEMYPGGEMSVKRAIIRFMLTSSNDDSVDKNGQIPAHVAKGLKALQELREKDPQTVGEAERFFILTPPKSSNPSS